MFPSEHFFSYLLGFVAGSEKPFKPRGSRRSEWQILAGVAVLFHGDKHAHTHTHTTSHTGRPTADREKLLLSFLLPPSGTREAFKEDMVSAAQAALPCSFPRGGTWAAAPGGRGEAPAQRRNPTFHASRKTAVGPLAPARHIAGQQNWEGAWENELILADWTVS